MHLATLCRGTIFHFFKPQLFVYLSFFTHSFSWSVAHFKTGWNISRRSRAAGRGRAPVRGRRRGWGCAPCTAGRSGCGPCAAGPAAAAARGTVAAGRVAAWRVAGSPAAPAGSRRAKPRRPPTAAPKATRSTLQRAPCSQSCVASLTGHWSVLLQLNVECRRRPGPFRFYISSAVRRPSRESPDARTQNAYY